MANGTKVLNLKLHHVYGAQDDPRKFTSSIFHGCMENKPSIDLTAGEQKRDFIHVDDAVDAYLHLLTRHPALEPAFSVFEVGTGRAVSIKEFAQTVHRLSNSTTDLRFGAIAYRKNELMLSVADPTALQKLGWNSKVSLPEGVSRVLAREGEAF